MRSNLNMLLYVALFLILLGLFLSSLLRSRTGTRASGDNTPLPGRGSENPTDGYGDKGE